MSAAAYLQIGARALEVQRVEAPLDHARGAGHERVGAGAPDRDRILLVQAQHMQELALQPRQGFGGLEVGEHQMRPRRRRARLGADGNELS